MRAFKLLIPIDLLLVQGVTLNDAAAIAAAQSCMSSSQREDAMGEDEWSG